MPLLGGIYIAWGGIGVGGILLRGVAASICLLPPTLLMGATLPAMSRWVESTPEGVSWLGFFYGGNIGGGVIGCLLAGFYLLRVHDIGGRDLRRGRPERARGQRWRWRSRRSPPTCRAAETAALPRLSNGAADGWPVYVAIGLSGMTALGAEVIWTRLLSLLFGATVYTFSLILAVFLFGLGIGSSIGSAIAATDRAARVLRSAGASCCSAPRSPGRPTCSRSRCRTGRSIRRSRPIPGSTSSSTSSAASGPSSRARSCGARAFRSRWRRSLPAARIPPDWLAASMPPTRSAPSSVRSRPASCSSSGSAASGHSRCWCSCRRFRHCSCSSLPLSIEPAENRDSSSPAPCCSPLRWAAAVLLARTIHAVPGILVAYGRYAATRIGGAEIIYVGEGWNASVAVSRLSNGVLNYHNAGKVQASSEPQDMRLQRMLGHMTTLIPPKPESVLVIGCGAGVTAGAVSVDPNVKSRHDRGDRAARPEGRVEVLQRATTSPSSTIPRRMSFSTTRGIFC